MNQHAARVMTGSVRSGVALVLACAVFATTASAATSTDKGQAPPVSHARSITPGEKALDPKNMDTSVKPGSDFFEYANGGWLKTHEIPADQVEWGGFVELGEHNTAVLQSVMDEAAAQKGAPAGSPAQMVGDFYVAAMDSARAEAEGAKPLADELARIQAITSTDALADEFVRLQSLGPRVPFFINVDQDPKESTAMQIMIGQAGLGLPDRDYYLKTDEASKKLRDQYVAHVTKIFTLLGDAPDQAAGEAQTVMTIETRLANASKTRVELRDREANYHRMAIDSLNALTPALGWSRLETALGVNDTHPLNVAQPEFVKEVNTMVTTLPLADWKTYLRWHWAHANAQYLSSDWVNADFDFFGKTLSGQQVMRPRWKRARRWVDQGVGEDLGQLYVAKAFPPDAKARALKMVENLRAELRDRIQHLAWMSDATKAQAIKKLDAFGVKIGYPEQWRDYTGLAIDRNSLVGDVVNSRKFEFRRNLNKLGKPVDRKEWGMTPPTVNAYYNPRRNEIVFPAGILQPPFFFPDADDAVNYGAIGAVIGHEMTHGFDDQGRKSDAEGNLKDWWQPDDAAKYIEQATRVQKQFDSFVAVDSLHVNGKLTLGEDIADLGGLSIAYGALERSLAGKPRTKIDGFTPEQRFFLAFAQIWREKMRPETMRMLVNTDPHAPGRFRVLGPLSNMKEFQEAFGLKAGDPMVRADDVRAKIW